MTKGSTEQRIAAFLRDASKWGSEMAKLRTIALECDLIEEVKWGKPCYTFEGGNVVLIGEFKEFCSLMFFKGALMKDPRGLLLRPGEHTQAGRWIKFTELREIVRLKSILKDYIHEAIALEKSGAKVKHKTTADYPVPVELKKRLAADPALKTAFAALTPGRQRGYLLYFAAAKQSQTRESRIDKWRQQILNGQGLLD